MEPHYKKILIKQLDESLSTLLLNIQFHKIGAYTIDVENMLLIYKEEKVSITAKESYLLVYFAHHLNQLVMREDVLNSIWNSTDPRCARSMDVYVVSMRKLLSKDQNIEIITIHGKGLKLMVR